MFAEWFQPNLHADRLLHRARGFYGADVDCQRTGVLQKKWTRREIGFYRFRSGWHSVRARQRDRCRDHRRLCAFTSDRRRGQKLWDHWAKKKTEYKQRNGEK